MFTLLFILLLSNDQIPFLADLYEKRNFTLIQRFLTEFRVVLFYIGQLFYPVESQFSVEHSFDLSNSLFDPVTTLFAILIVFALVITAIRYKNKFPILSFAILFYFLNHIVESTILPLEIVFEHRNYIPSMFIFFPLSIGFFKLISHYKKENFALYILLILFMQGLLIFTGLGTYSRNITWMTDGSLWKDAMKKAPGNSRPYQNYSYHLSRTPDAKSDKILRQIFELNKTALDKVPSGVTKRMQTVSLTNIATSLTLQEKYEEALKYREKLLDLRPEYNEGKFHAAKLYLILKKDKKALDVISSITSIKDSHLNLHALALLKNNMPDEALKVLFKIRKKKTKDSMLTLTHLAGAYYLKNELKKARYYLNFSIKKYPGQMGNYLFMIEVCGLMNDTVSQEQIGKKLLDRWSFGKIFKKIETMQEEKLQPDLSFETIVAYLQKLAPEYYAELKHELLQN